MRSALIIVAVAVAGLLNAGQVQAATPTTYYLDCAAGSDGNAGTSPTAAWKSLAKVNATTFAAGDAILLKRGTSCPGSLSPKGSGVSGSPITVGAYGTGAKPVIAGGGVAAAVRLVNQQQWEIRDLEISNRGATTGPRRGVSVELTDYGQAAHFVFENLDIHDVNGEDKKDLGGAAGFTLPSLGKPRAPGSTASRSATTRSRRWTARASSSCPPGTDPGSRPAARASSSAGRTW